ncbi:tryptophan synthase beta subunit-like PLP-dependent enzyme [Ilyonectria sp. MPI-CAGE-AT-0026]|nr:tryptophan synthase beta subunit-like PLP-dependent enzyme [Ilyonectria sp. MPI-CAGE-AT-0026]
MTDHTLQLASAALDAIGNTLAVCLHSVVPKGHADAFLKLEHLNPTGSYKDRMAKSAIEEAGCRGALRPGITVVEVTYGSTGPSMAFVCAVKGYKLRAASCGAYLVAKFGTMSAFGAAGDLIQSPSGQATADLVPRMTEHTRNSAQRGIATWRTSLRTRTCSLAMHSLATSRWSSFQGIDGFCGVVDAAGMATPVAKGMKSRLPQVRILFLEPASAPTITDGRYRTHTVEGIGLGFVPPLLDRELHNEARSIHEGEARAMCRRLAKEEYWLLVRGLGPGRTVVTIACDTGLRYMDGDLYDDGFSLPRCERTF